MKQVLAIARETFLSLKRDKIFQPLSIIIAAAVGVAIFAADWSLESRSQVYHDIVVFIFQVSGALISMIWGVKIISDSKQDGSIELSMSRPLSRSRWLFGRMLGLFFSLLAMSVVTGLIWRLGAIVYDIETNIPWFSIALAQTTLLWFITGAVAIFMSSFTGAGTALFASISIWILGLLTRPIATGLVGGSNPAAKQFTEFLAKLWSLSSLIPESHGTIISVQARQQTALYALAILAALYFMGAAFAHFKDINS
jgi:ABC-type transport system involved in multi-copper enzyme maturation permease subunit